MPMYVALLRGINVSGHKIIKMEALRDSLATLGLGNIKTYVQSGNVVFEAKEAKEAGEAVAVALGEKIARKILKDFGFEAPVFITTGEKLAGTVRRNPLLKLAGIDEGKLHVTFLAGDPPADGAERLQPLAAAEERLHVSGREVFLYCPNGYGNSKLANTAIEKKFAVGATTRNWKTVTTLLAMTQ